VSAPRGPACRQTFLHRCRASMAHIRQSRPDSGLGFHAKSLKPFKLFPVRLAAVHMVEFCTLHPTPCTLNPTPCTLHPTPCTLHPSPYTPHPTPYTLHPTPYTLHPAPYTLHPTSYTLHPSFYPVSPDVLSKWT